VTRLLLLGLRLLGRRAVTPPMTGRSPAGFVPGPGATPFETHPRRITEELAVTPSVLRATRSRRFKNLHAPVGNGDGWGCRAPPGRPAHSGLPPPPLRGGPERMAHGDPRRSTNEREAPGSGLAILESRASTSFEGARG